MAQPPNDEDLYRRLRAGDPTAAMDLVEWYKDEVCRHIRTLLRRWNIPVHGIQLQECKKFHSQVESVFNSIFSKFLEKIKTDGLEYSEGSKLVAYMITMVKNHFLSLSRANQRHTNEGFYRLSAYESPIMPPDAAAAKQELMEKYKRLLGTLSAKEQELVALRVHHGHSYDEIAEKLGMATAQTARARFADCIRKLRDLSGE